MSKPTYEYLDHTADLTLHVTASSLQEVLVTAASAMMEYIFGDDALCEEATRQERITIAAADRELLLVDWLSRLLYDVTTLRHMYLEYSIEECSDTVITASVGSCPQQAIRDIKAVTYYDLSIKEIDGQLEAFVTFDI